MDDSLLNDHIVKMRAVKKQVLKGNEQRAMCLDTYET